MLTAAVILLAYADPRCVASTNAAVSADTNAVAALLLTVNVISNSFVVGAAPFVNTLEPATVSAILNVYVAFGIVVTSDTIEVTPLVLRA